MLGTRSSIRRARFRSYIDVIKLKDMITFEQLKEVLVQCEVEIQSDN